MPFLRPLRALREWRTLHPDNRRLLKNTLVVVAFVRLGLTLSSYRALRGVLPRLIGAPQRAEAPLDERTVNRIVWAVMTSSRAIPGATCLTQAIAAQTMLARRGEEARVHIGVAKNADKAGKFEAHAWVEHAGQIIIGGTPEELARYSRIAAFDVPVAAPSQAQVSH